MISTEKMLVLVLLTLTGVGCGDSDDHTRSEESNAIAQAQSEVAANGRAVDPIEPLEQQTQAVSLDSDADGVLDEFDRCKSTLAGVAVDADGCRLRLKAARRFPIDVRFATGSAVIVNIGDVGAVLDLLEQFPEAQLIVEGHTDSVGSAQANEVLSQKRADTVGDAFVDRFDVKRSRITTRGFGAAKPVADNATADGRAANRRVEVVVTPGV